jgi:glutathione synthase/RimK-type ligase-like ATP-grasp enzyme
MKEIILHSLESIRKKLKTGKNCCFELFGYDFITDGDFGVWLIEVNTNPCIEESS